jgi:outer membrane receptor for ferrienterochelin and colicin
MASSDRRVSLSVGEQQRTSRSYRTPPDIIVHEGHDQQEDIFSGTSRRNTQETNRTKRSESLVSHRSRSTTITSNVSRKKKSSLNSSAPSTKNHRIGSKRKKNSISINELESKYLFQLNDSEKQDLSACGLRTVPTESFDRKFTTSFILLTIILS